MATTSCARSTGSSRKISLTREAKSDSKNGKTRRVRRRAFRKTLLVANQRNADGVYFASQPPCVPTHCEISPWPFAYPDAFSVSVHSVVFAPVLMLSYVMLNVLSTRLEAPPFTYFVVDVEHPAVLMSGGQLECVLTYSETEVLHAASAASASDIFERTT